LQGIDRDCNSGATVPASSVRASSQSIKEAIVHIPDKHDLMREVFRVLKPGGRYWWAKSLRE